MRKLMTFLVFVLLLPGTLPAEDGDRIPIRDLATVEGLQPYPLVGYGLVVGLNGTGDRRQTVFSTQMLANLLQRMGVQVAPTAMRVNNIGAVLVTANLPAFARAGSVLDVTVSSIGDAKSLEGGTLILTPLRATDGQVYAVAQGVLTVGGYAAGGGGNAKQVNHPTVGRIPAGALVDHAPVAQLRSSELSLLLRDSSFAAATGVAEAINREYGVELAQALDDRTVQVRPGARVVPEMLARIEKLTVMVPGRAKVVINERTGTIVIGKQVRLGAVSVLHGSLVVEVSTEWQPSQPTPFSKGETIVVPETKLEAKEIPARRVQLAEGATVEQLVAGLQGISATPRDIIAILQAIKVAGALHADLEVI